MTGVGLKSFAGSKSLTDLMMMNIGITEDGVATIAELPPNIWKRKAQQNLCASAIYLADWKKPKLRGNGWSSTRFSKAIFAPHDTICREHGEIICAKPSKLSGFGSRLQQESSDSNGER